MPFTVLLREDVQEWISAHMHKPVHELALQKSPFPEIEMKELVQQVQGRQTATRKFEQLNQKGILFPPKINLEQTSSQITAAYKANLIKGDLLMDLTGGFGIDTMAFAQNFDKVIHLEQNAELQPLAAHNFKQLGLNNMSSFSADGVEFLAQSNEMPDVIYVDPSRRDEQQKRVFLLEDLQPDLTQLAGILKEKAKAVMIKLSPLIDLTYLTETLEDITAIHVVAVRNEVKEVLVLIGGDQKAENDINVVAVNLETNHEAFSFRLNEQAETAYAEPERYIYKPNAAVIKSGGMDLLGKQFDLKKLHPNTQLFTSEKLQNGFPGRVFEVGETVKNPKKLLKGRSIQAIHRNFPQNLRTLKKQFGFHTDGIMPVLFTQSQKKVYINYMTEVNFNV